MLACDNMQVLHFAQCVFEFDTSCCSVTNVQALRPSFTLGWHGAAGLGTTARMGLLSWGEPGKQKEAQEHSNRGAVSEPRPTPPDGQITVFVLCHCRAHSLVQVLAHQLGHPRQDVSDAVQPFLKVGRHVRVNILKTRNFYDHWLLKVKFDRGAVKLSSKSKWLSQMTAGGRPWSALCPGGCEQRRCAPGSLAEFCSSPPARPAVTLPPRWPTPAAPR